MAVESLQDKINQGAGALGMPRTAHAGAHPILVLPNWWHPPKEALTCAS